MSASINDKITDTSSGVRPTSSTVSTIRNSGATTLACADLTGWPTGSAVHFVTYSVDASGDIMVGSQTDWKGIVSGSNINSLTVTGGTDSGNSAGDYVVMLPTAAWGSDLYDGLTATLNQVDGTLKDSIVTTAKINDSAVTTAKLAASSVTSAKMAPTKSTDANSWTIYDFGSFKKYRKNFGPYSAASVASLGQTTLSSSADMPVGIAPSTVFMSSTWFANNANSTQMLVAPAYDSTSASTTYTYSIQLRNVTGSTLSYSDVYLKVELITK